MHAPRSDPLFFLPLTGEFTRCRFHVERDDRNLEEVLAWFSQAMGLTMAALYYTVGPEWVSKVIQSGANRWKAHHYQLMQKKTPKRPYQLKAEGGSDGKVSS